MTNENNGWGEYSRLVLKELETLAQGIKDLNESLNDMKREITEIRAREDKVQELVKWKERIDDIVSPTQLDQMKKEVQDLKDFKTKALAGFTVIQFLMGLILFYDKLV